MSEQQIPKESEATLLPTPGALIAAADAARRKIEDDAKAGAVAIASLEQLVTDAKAKLAEIVGATTEALAAKTKIVDDQTVIATKSAHIQDAQEHADKVRADLDRAFTAATQQVTAAEAEKSKAQAAAESAGDLLTKTQTIKASIEAEALTVEKARKTAEESTAVTKGLADKSAEVEASIADYARRLADLGEQSAKQLKTIEDLLPGATTTGLAYAFNERRQTFLKPHNLWQWLFVSSVGIIVLVAGTGLYEFYKNQETMTFTTVGLLWLARLPIAAALVWLAMYAARESALAKRLEEDYGFKAAVAQCFEGFKNQMSGVGKDVDPNSALAKLLDNTLTTIADPPGRIYEKHELIVSPTEELKLAAEAVVKVANAANPGVKKLISGS